MTEVVFERYMTLLRGTWKPCLSKMHHAGPYAKQDSNVLVLAADYCMIETTLELLKRLSC